MSNQDKKMSLLDLSELSSIMSIVQREIPVSQYYEQINKNVIEVEGQLPTSERLYNILLKLSSWVKPQRRMEFVKYHPHLAQFFPDVDLDDEIAKRLEEDKLEYEKIEAQE